MAQYQCFIDLGSSGTKTIFNNGESLTPFQCPPLVADLPPSELSIIEAQGQQFGTGLESIGYIQLAPDEPAFALGEDAQGRPNKSTGNLPKSALAHVRALGVIGEFAYQCELDYLKLDVGIALPFSEYLADYRTLTSKIMSHQTFTYRGRDISLEFDQVKVLPEAAGLVQWRKVELAQTGAKQNKTFAVLMFGHRDLSFLLFRDGKPPQGEPSGTEHLGYQKFLMAISRDLPCNSDDPFLYDAIVSGASRVSFPSRPGEIYPLADRVERAKAYYWDLVRYRLDEWLAAVDIAHYEVLLSGGVALQLEPELDEYFLERAAFCTLNWLEGLKLEVTANLGLDSEVDQVRFSDCYGGAKWMALKFQKGAVHISQG